MIIRETKQNKKKLNETLNMWNIRIDSMKNELWKPQWNESKKKIVESCLLFVMNEMEQVYMAICSIIIIIIIIIRNRNKKQHKQT